MRNNNSQYSNPYFPKKNAPVSLKQWFTKADGWAYLASVVLMLAVLSYVFIQQRWLFIDYITVTGNQFLQVQQVTQPASELLNQRKFAVVSGRLYPFFDEQAFQEELYTTLSEQYALESLVVTAHYYDRVEVTIEERVPGYTYTIGAAHYYMDDQGVLTEQVLNELELNPFFPRIRDSNSHTVAVGDTVVKPERVSVLSDLVRDFTDQSGLNISELAFEEVTCQEKQFVAEEIFESEIEETEDDSIRAEKEFILEQLQNDKITVDQSLALLEEIKLGELDENGEPATINPNGGFVELKAKFVPTDCDYTAVLQDISVVTQEGPRVYFDTTVPIQTQLDNLRVVLTQNIEDLSAIEYIDVRFEDKVFYR